MRITPMPLTIRDGRAALIRCAEESDAENAVRFLVQRASETEFMMKDPDECGTASDMRSFIRDMNRSATDLMLVCVVEGAIVGSAELVRKKHRKTCHRAEISVGTLRAFWEQGIGSALMRAVTETAEARGVSQLELNVFEGNDRAVGLYRALGFETVAVRPNCVHLRDGRQLAAVTMFKALNPAGRASSPDTAQSAVESPRASSSAPVRGR